MNRREFHQLMEKVDHMEGKMKNLKERKKVLRKKEEVLEKRLTLEKEWIIDVTHVEEEAMIHNKNELGGMDLAVVELNLEDVADVTVKEEELEAPFIYSSQAIFVHDADIDG